MIHQRRGMLSATASRDPPSPIGENHGLPRTNPAPHRRAQPTRAARRPDIREAQPRVTTTLCEAFLPARFGAGAHSVVSLSKGEWSQAFACRLGNTELERVTVRTLAYTDASL